ncbi:hypothetical protein K432DRAFT_407782 [Lepidopterella palustris CBS 459.81]|uniref:Uncharacterized protein n=1 Tax=Lepidopterella palustris CBS 459.81 TaxID=1314670 RepID=A0A8E2JCE2_9PEZI|nr:hypothetical protein K432DRAFT_407782 [Lepidopterella palustris CBS 459.81]
MASSTHSPTLRSLYRRILRELPSRTGASPGLAKLSSPSTLRQRIRSSFATSSASSSSLPAAVEAAKIQEVEQFVQYLQAQRQYETLIERYNPGVAGMDEEERVRLTARKVGMNLPVEFEKGEK